MDNSTTSNIDRRIIGAGILTTGGILALTLPQGWWTGLIVFVSFVVGIKTAGRPLPREAIRPHVCNCPKHLGKCHTSLCSAIADENSNTQATKGDLK